MDVLSLETVITGIAGGGLAYPATNYVLLVLANMGISVPKQYKRWLSMVVAFALAIGALVAGQQLGYLTLTPDSVWTAFASAFVASQAVHGAVDLGRRG